MTSAIHNLSRAILSALLVVLLFGAAGVVMPRTVSALPLQYLAAVGAPCILPDGTLKGLITNDGHTCCPEAVVNRANYAVDPTQCLYAKYINPLVDLLASAVGVIVVIAIVYGAIEYISSGGDPQRTAAGKKRIIEALIGLVAFVLLYAFLQFLVPGGLFNNG